MNIMSLTKRVLYGTILILLITVSCGHPREGKSVQNGNVSAAGEVMSSIPAERLLRYWDAFNFKAKVQTNNSDDVEQKLVDFIALFATVPDTVVQVAVHGMLDDASVEPQNFAYFVDRYSHYLYDPNSPMRNEGYYEQVLTYLVAYQTLPEEERSKYAVRLELIRKNQVGTVATDFEYLAKDGKYRRMHEGTKPYKLLVFYDPTCTQCAALMLDLAQTPAVHNCITNGFLEIVSVSLYPNKDSWMGYQKRIPDNWINGWDEKGHIIHDGLYNIRAYPTIFLLNNANTVLLKDAPLDVTLRYLANVVSHS
ncbi:DUF5106 domain-containing protein [Sphingobacterium corticibacterium]|uniref:DUF5106 domain-containing protein n=1 Tax=Sphingobacterium corticibacterium TaxID=2484746 RepID=A0A4Q6XH62_9SPHI|nr:DUF5106 domain-containing protein [Sphingobacterium corticibacterium]RZF58873.1 DUF5106 domain-containing protein [Sphingobacterium corticibacterium]